MSRGKSDVQARDNRTQPIARKGKIDHGSMFGVDELIITLLKGERDE
jgi:hypothetical protein